MFFLADTWFDWMMNALAPVINAYSDPLNSGHIIVWACTIFSGLLIFTGIAWTYYTFRKPPVHAVHHYHHYPTRQHRHSKHDYGNWDKSDFLPGESYDRGNYSIPEMSDDLGDDD